MTLLYHTLSCLNVKMFEEWLRIVQLHSGYGSNADISATSTVCVLYVCGIVTYLVSCSFSGMCFIVTDQLWVLACFILLQRIPLEKIFQNVGPSQTDNRAAMVVCLCAALRVKLFAIVVNGWPLMHLGIISSCQSAATSETVKHRCSSLLM